MNTAVKNRNLMKVITCKDTVMAYLNVNAPKAAPGGGEPKDSVCLLIPKSDETTFLKIQTAIRAMGERKNGCAAPASNRCRSRACRAPPSAISARLT